MKKILLYVFIGALIISGCGGGGNAAQKPLASEFNYEEVDATTDEFKQNRELNKWYLENYQAKGKYKINSQGRTYILISAGQKSTGGYNMEILDITANDSFITITTEVREPESDQFTTMAITYPHVLIAIPEDNRSIIWEDVTGNK